MTRLILFALFLLPTAVASAGPFGLFNWGYRCRGGYCQPCRPHHYHYHQAPTQKHYATQKATPTQKTPHQKGEPLDPPHIEPGIPEPPRPGPRDSTQIDESPVQRAAAWRASQLAAKGYGHHFALPCYGASGEGWGWGNTPQQALNNCCVTASGRVAAQATARSPHGGWYAIRLYW